MSDAPPAVDDPGYVGRIPVRNLWLLMLYASDLFRLRGDDFVNREDLPDDLPDIVAEILAHAVEQRQRRNLNRAYASRREVLTRVRGSIDVLATETRQLVRRGMVACRYEELTIDTPRNRYIRGALELIAGLVEDAGLATRCRRLARTLRDLGVTGVVPSPRQASADRFGRHDANDRFMVAAAKLAFDLALPTETRGDQFLPIPDRDPHRLRKLFERAVYGFYNVVLPSQGWQVAPGRLLRWPVAARTPGLDDILPTMKTDVELEHPASHRKIVIDTKFTEIVTSGRFRDTVRSGYLYQIYAYLRSQESPVAPTTPTEGVLLQPVVGQSFDEAARIQGHLFRFATVDLAASPQQFRRDLLRIVAPLSNLQVRQSAPPT